MWEDKSFCLKCFVSTSNKTVYEKFQDVNSSNLRSFIFQGRHFPTLKLYTISSIVLSYQDTELFKNHSDMSIQK